MRRAQGFSLIELLIVVAIILVIAAIAIPSLIRARISANETAMVSEIRTFIAAEAAFSGQAGGYGDITCLRNPGLCLAGAGAMPLIDAVLGDTTVVKSGYRRIFATDGRAYSGQGVLGGVFTGYCYGGVPASQGRTGVRSFSGDFTGRVVQNPLGVPCCIAGENDGTNCGFMGS
jgi:type IV pilus assembly protein PilA